MGHTLRTRWLGRFEESSLKGAATSRGPRYDKSHPGAGLAREADTAALVERRQLEFLSQFSSQHAESLCRQRLADSDTSRERRLLNWCAQFSSASESRQSKLLETESPANRAAPAGEQFARALRESRSWDASKHPRGGYPENRGWWSPAEGGGSGKSEALLRDLDKTGLDPSWNDLGDPDAEASRHRGGELLAVGPYGAKGKSIEKGKPPAEVTFSPKDHAYLPSEKKGHWSGKKGESDFILKEPIDSAFGKVDRIEFKGGFPVLDKFKSSGEAPTIVVTGNPAIDQANARKMWQQVNPGAKIPENVIFHHDALHVTETLAKTDGKQMRVVVGKMFPIPPEIHAAVHHEGSAAIVRKFYKSIGADMADVTKFAGNQAEKASFVLDAKKAIVGGQLPDTLKPHAGRRRIAKAIPIIGTGLKILTFAQDVQADGLPMAIASATPVLGDLIAAHQVGSEIAQWIVDTAKAKSITKQQEMDLQVFKARQKADEQTIAAFQELAPQIDVTNIPSEGRDLVDSGEVAEALAAYRAWMQIANLHKEVETKNFDYEKVAAEAKRRLKERLIHASQKNGPTMAPVHGPLS